MATDCAASKIRSTSTFSKGTTAPGVHGSMHPKYHFLFHAISIYITSLLRNINFFFQRINQKLKGNSGDVKDIGVLLLDSDECSLSTKIHYAQLAGVSLLLIKYIDDAIEEAEVEKFTFSGVKIPVLLIRDSEAM